jgi:CRP/FNR family cyclic AMP-dependent transcriptional regulator
MEDIALLSEVPLFASLNPDHLEELASKLTLQRYKRDETIFHQGDPGSVLYIIRAGQVKIYNTSLDGEDVILNVLTDGDFFGELSLLDGQPRSANATAMDATQVLVLHQHDFLGVLHGDLEMCSKIMATLSQRLRRLSFVVEDGATLSLAARIAKRLLELGDKRGVETDEGLEIDLRLTQQDLANLVGASREAVNRQLGLLQDNDTIRIDGQRIIIARPEELRKRI